MSSPASAATLAAYSRIAGEMSVASTCPVGTDPTGGREGLAAGAGGDVEDARARPRGGRRRACVSVAAPSQSSMAGPQRCQASAAASHWARVVALEGDGVEVRWSWLPPVGRALDASSVRRSRTPVQDEYWTQAGQFLDLRASGSRAYWRGEGLRAVLPGRARQLRSSPSAGRR